MLRALPLALLVGCSANTSDRPVCPDETTVIPVCPEGLTAACCGAAVLHTPDCVGESGSVRVVCGGGAIRPAGSPRCIDEEYALSFGECP